MDSETRLRRWARDSQYLSGERVGCAPSTGTLRGERHGHGVAAQHARRRHLALIGAMYSRQTLAYLWAVFRWLEQCAALSVSRALALRLQLDDSATA